MCKVPLVMLLLQAKTATQRLQEEDFSVQTLAQNFQEDNSLLRISRQKVKMTIVKNVLSMIVLICLWIVHTFKNIKNKTSTASTEKFNL